MDKLADLPPVETRPTEKENQVLKKYFDADKENVQVSSSPTWMQTFKLAIYATVLFLALCNPITDAVFCRLPYCGEGVVTLLTIKCLIFMLSFVALYKFV